MNVKIGTKIKELRKRDDVTQERLADALGVTSQAISKWESESGYPDIEYIAPIANFFGVSIDCLFDRNNSNTVEDIVKKIKDNYGLSNFLITKSDEIKKPIHYIIKNSSEENIQDPAKHLMGVINDILDISKITDNGFRLSATEFDFRKTIQKIVDLVNPRIEERNQNFTFNIDPAIPNILLGDESRLAQVITNLIANAIKFTPNEGLITLDAQLVSEGRLRISITDTGIGISDEQKARLFAPDSKSTGLGLIIASVIVALMDGEISVESELGKGSTFSFTVCLNSASSESARESSRRV